MALRARLWERLAGPTDLGRSDPKALIRRADGNDTLASPPGFRDDVTFIKVPTFRATPRQLAVAFDNAMIEEPYAEQVARGDDHRR